MKKSFIMFIFSVCCSLQLSAFVISIAPVKIYSDEPVSISGAKMAEKISSGNLFLSFAGSASEGISNILQASSFCEKEGIDYLIYGSLTRNRQHDSVQLRFYSHDSRTIEHVFYAGDNAEETGRLIMDLKAKINRYLAEEMALYEPQDKQEKSLLISVPIAAGYWVPIDPYWGEFSVALFSLRSGLIFNPFEELVNTEHLSLNFHFGMNLIYEMAINASGYEDFSQHKIKMLLPVELSLSLLEKHRFSLIIAPLYQLEILSKRRNYQEKEIRVSNGFGFSTGIGYHHNFSNRFSSGLSCSFDFIFYENPQVSIRPELSFLIHCGSTSTEKGKTQK